MPAIGRMFVVAALAWYLAGTPARAAEQAEAHFWFLTYTPGENFNTAQSLDEQVGIREHEEYLRELYRDGIALMAGSIVGTQSRRLLLRTSSREEAQVIADADPAVMSRILTARLEGWRVNLSSMRYHQPLMPEVSEPDEPFRVERIDPNAPINLRNPDSPD